MHTLAAYNSLSYFHSVLQLVRDFNNGKSMSLSAQSFAEEQIQMKSDLGAHEYRETFCDNDEPYEAKRFYIVNEPDDNTQCPLRDHAVTLASKHSNTKLSSENLYTAQCILEDILMNNPDHKELECPILAPSYIADILFDTAVNMDKAYEILTSSMNVENNHCWDFEIIPRAIAYIKARKQNMVTMNLFTWVSLIKEIIDECDAESLASMQRQGLSQ